MAQNSISGLSLHVRRTFQGWLEKKVQIEAHSALFSLGDRSHLGTSGIKYSKLTRVSFNIIPTFVGFRSLHKLPRPSALLVLGLWLWTQIANIIRRPIPVKIDNEV